MELVTVAISLPAVFALAFKAGIFAYIRLLHVHSPQARIYLYFLFVLAVQNIVEISHFYNLARGVMPHFEITAFYAFGILALALFFHLSLSFASSDFANIKARLVLAFVYLYAIILEVLLIFTPWLISDFTRMTYTVTRVPGPLYSAFEVFAFSISLGVICLLAYAATRQDTTQKRLKAKLMLAAIIPMILVVTGVLALLHFGVKRFNASLIYPFATTYFLSVTAYAIHQHRLFDIGFLVPWSKVRKRKTAFYGRIRAMIAEIADLGSVREAVHRLADTLRCPVALVSTGKPVLAVAGGALLWAGFALCRR